jgi:disulfide bond formation protein DsbB
MSLFAAARRSWPVLALLASAAMLAAAHAFEAAGYTPCALCLRQREVYWGAIGVGAAGLLLQRFWTTPNLHRGICLLLGAAFLAGAGVALYHAGVEWKLLPAPDACATTGAVSAGDLESALSGRRVIAAPCDEAAWRDPVAGLSMAAWNAIVSLALAGASFWAAALPVVRGETRDDD